MEEAAALAHPLRGTQQPGPFEKMCAGMQPVCTHQAMSEEDKAWLADMAADTTHPFVPIDHLRPALQNLTYMVEELHSQPTGPQAYLLTGPRGVGKTHLQKAYAKQVAVRNPRAGGGHTLCCSINLAVHKPSNTSSFYEWLLGSISRKLSELKEYESVTEVLELLASSAHGEPRETVDVEHLLSMASAEGDAASAAPSGLSPEVCAVLADEETDDWLGLASAVLREANIAVIVLIDGADCLFQGKHFTRECADLWCAQLRYLLSLEYPAVGVVLCTAFQRAQQLFAYDRRPHEFPPRFTHHELRKDWDEALLRYIRVGGPVWSRTSLTAFLLTYAGRKVDRTFSLFQRHLGQQPSEAALRVARDLDKLCLGGWKGDAGASSAEKLDAFLVHIMEQYGQTPQDLIKAVHKLVQACREPWTWPVATEEAAGEADMEQPVPMPELLMDTFHEILSDAKQVQLAKDTLLTFRSGQYTVTRTELESTLEVNIPRQARQAAVAAGYGAARPAPALTIPTALQCVDTALDAGWLTLHPRGLGLGSLHVYRQNLCGGVHPDIIKWMRGGGFGKQAEMPTALVFARTQSPKGGVLVKRADGSVWCGNDDARTPTLTW